MVETQPVSRLGTQILKLQAAVLHDFRKRPNIRYLARASHYLLKARRYLSNEEDGEGERAIAEQVWGWQQIMREGLAASRARRDKETEEAEASAEESREFGEKLRSLSKEFKDIHKGFQELRAKQEKSIANLVKKNEEIKAICEGLSARRKALEERKRKEEEAKALVEDSKRVGEKAKANTEQVNAMMIKELRVGSEKTREEAFEALPEESRDCKPNSEQDTIVFISDYFG
ncbi:hypothetical protein ACP275_11G067300 [Erythranthe tilingii]